VRKATHPTEHLSGFSADALRTLEAFLEASAVSYESRAGPWVADGPAIVGAATLRRVARCVFRFRQSLAEHASARKLAGDLDSRKDTTPSSN